MRIRKYPGPQGQLIVQVKRSKAGRGRSLPQEDHDGAQNPRVPQQCVTRDAKAASPGRLKIKAAREGQAKNKDLCLAFDKVDIELWRDFPLAHRKTVFNA